MRKLSHKRAGEIMVEKFGQQPEVVENIGRWERIDFIRHAVRDPHYTAMVNADPELAQYVRSVKISLADQIQKMRELAKRVWDEQVGGIMKEGAKHAGWLSMQVEGARVDEIEGDMGP